MKNFTKETIEKFDYLPMFIKECQRVDGVATASFNQSVHKEFEIDGVRLLKGTHIQYNLIGIHQNPDQFISPEKFLPERFDASSPYFSRPSGTPRHPLAVVPFSCG